ncbi:chromosome segregation protein SMC [candidate division KSB1 bacterium]|nr:chromosome segregation protein SMC [candidate division KSB1 bacterium]
MILSKVSIHGFKSFAKKTELKFDGGITAVVGPNGCGKTNIVDAIRWGLGEQRPSVLRADRMENIIFGGAKSARPLGLAEVSITFDNSAHILPIDYNEVVITRRLYRSGESEYIMNKTPVRLKDIQDLLMDTGIGADMYSVIELKMIEDILSDKAEDRRKLLEEAAGVTKYKHRLKAAIRKLDATQNDLLRVNDIVQEIERNVRSLKRQVQKAKRYHELKEEIQHLDTQRSRTLYQQLIEQIKPLKEEAGALKQQKEGRTTEISKEEADLETIRLKLTEREKALIASQEKLTEITERTHRREGDIRVGRERLSSLQNRIERYTTEVDELGKRLEDQKNHREVTQRDRETLQVKITSTNRLFQNKKKELDIFQQGLNFKRLELNEKKKEIIGCLEEINRLSAEETQYRTKIDNSRGRLERLEEEDKGSQDSVRQLEADFKAAEAAFQSLKSEQNELTVQKQKSESELERERQSINSIKEQIIRDQSDIELLQGRIQFIQSVLESFEGMSDGAKILVRDKVSGLMGVLADMLQTDKKYRSAIETGLGEAAQYLLFKDASSAKQALVHLKNKGGGRAMLVAVDRTQTAVIPVRPDLPKDAVYEGWADEFVQCDKVLKPAASYLLGDLLVVKDMESAENILSATPKIALRIVTLDGELITAWGAIQTREAKEQDSGLIGRKQRLEELERQIQSRSATSTKNESILKSLQEKEQILLQKTASSTQSLAALDSKLLETEKSRASLQYGLNRNEEGLKKNSDERSRLLTEIESGREGLENLRPKMEALTDNRESMEEATILIQNEVERLEDEERIMEEEVHKHNLAVVRLTGDAKNLDYDLERSSRLIEETEKTIEQRGLEIKEADESITKQTLETEENEKLLLQEISEKEKQEELRTEKDRAYQTLKEEFQIKEKEIRGVRKVREEAADRIHNMEMQLSDLEHQARSLIERVQDSYQIDLKAIESDPEFDQNTADSSLEELKFKIRQIGPVNLVALKEYEVESERFEFLNQQRDDLLNAEATLNETIKKINLTARSRFIEIYSQVRQNFQIMFSRFFQGGEADLRLPEDEDPLEAKVEIMARPAGKQLRDIDLLSGGEKALTAISLLFALYMVKPSPFCILDEVDAPLDDANVERFARVLAEYAQKTQFVIVSHNKMTMKAAQALYGVTMEEEGVSKLVSVKFDD